MAVPKKRTTSSSRDQRRMHIFLEKPTLTKCSKCGHFILPHTICQFCGYYKGREVIDVLARLTKKEKKRREKEIKTKEKEEKETAKDSKEKPLNLKELSKK